MQQILATARAVIRSLSPNNATHLKKGVKFVSKSYFSGNQSLQTPLLTSSQHLFQELHHSVPSVLSRNASILQMHTDGPFRKIQKKHKPTDGRPQMKGVVLKTFVMKPKKPNSANRKCVRLRLSNGREAIAYVPGEGHNLQEHSVVLVYPKNVLDLPGVRLKCIRGKYDLQHVVKK